MESRKRSAAWIPGVIVVSVWATACARHVSPLFGDGAARDVNIGPDALPTVCDASVEVIAPEAIDQLDLLLVVDNSNSMRENQSNIAAQFRPMLDALTNPPDNNRDGLPDYPPVRDLHFGVVSTDLGTPGATVPGCANSDVGDDGLLNPIRFGQAMARHEPWTSAPMGFRPDDCMQRDQFPSFLWFRSSSTNVAQFAHDAVCNAALYVNGCGTEQPLEAAYRALVWHDASDRPGNASPNAGFLRSQSLLMIVLLTDEEDASVRDCRYAERGVPCEDATDVFQMGSTRWGAPNLNMRFYLAQPCGPQDATWSLDRYVDPRNLQRGFLGLRPGHPERVLFAAITGVPLAVPTVNVAGETRTDWNALLGAPDPVNPDNFCRRNPATAYNNPTNAEGPISMRQSNIDPACSERTVPSCRREGTMYNPARPPCNPSEQYYAWPARRVVEVARRFDESALCGGAPCRNGVVTSICRQDFSAATELLTRRIRYRLVQRCL